MMIFFAGFKRRRKQDSNKAKFENPASTITRVAEWMPTETYTSNKPAILLEKEELNFSFHSESATRKA